MNEAEHKKLVEKIDDAVKHSSTSSTYASNASLTDAATIARFNLEDYLDKYVEGYLFKDIESIIKYVPSDLHPGAAAYPMILTICSGIEFLGAILRPALKDDFSDDDGLKYFGHYWKNYLSRYKPEYKPYAELARALLRNGLAHLFMAKPKVGVVQSNPSLHLQMYNDSLIFDATILFEDFKQSYFEVAKPTIMDGKSGTQLADKRMHQILAKYSTDAEMVFKALKPHTLNNYDDSSTKATITVSGTTN